jgi:hypothetical protein
MDGVTIDQDRQGKKKLAWISYDMQPSTVLCILIYSIYLVLAPVLLSQ